MEEQVKRAYSDIRSKFNFDLSPTQLKVISSVVEGKDAFAVMPTGAEKCMTFIVPPLLSSIHQKSTALVISPSLAPSMNHTKFLRERGISACVLQRDMPTQERKDLNKGKAQIIFSSPEMIIANLARIENVYGEKIGLLAFDEVHCMSEWGNDFRPYYRKMSGLRSSFNAPVLALSATVTRKIQRDVMATLCMEDDAVIVSSSPDRPEMFISIRKSTRNYDDELGWTISHIKNHGINSKKILIYTNSINECSKLFEWLMINLGSDAYVIDKDGLMLRLVDMYHAHLTPTTRESLISNLTKTGGHLKILVATRALGMGVQIPDITAVIQWGLPPTLLDFWQMSGRCAQSEDSRGISVTYCLPGSILRTKDLTLRSLVKTSACLRGVVLRELSVGKTTPMPQTRTPCNLHCTVSCRCSLCMCCDICRTNCNCVSNSNDVIEEFLWEGHQS